VPPVSHADAERLIVAIDTLADQLTPKRRPQDARAPECSAQELRALNAISHAGRLTMGELAAILRTPISTATRIVDRLSEKGLAERQQLAGDRRIVHVTFSRRGRTIDRYVVQSRRAAAAAILKAIPPRDRTAVLDRLTRMATIASRGNRS
jgi:DNA-binding MarR family transcriptional regulator